MMLSDPRSQKAAELATDAGQWLRVRTRDGVLAYAIPSQRIDNLYWIADAHSCTCPDFVHNGLNRTRLGRPGLHVACKHLLAIRLHERGFR